MSSALWIGTTGLSASTKEMDVIGNNLANSNTIGYKCGQVSFSSMLSQSLSGGGGNQQVGQGVGVAAVTTSFAQGSYETTGSATDLAIDGTGFFIVKNAKDDLTYYTRAGSFFINENGNLVDNSGYMVQGRMFDEGEESTSMTSINLTGQKSAPNETKIFELGMNLDSEMSEYDTVPYFTTSQTIYDSQGSKHALASYAYRGSDIKVNDEEKGLVSRSMWYLKARIDSADTTDADMTIPDRPWLEFDDNGKLMIENARGVIAGQIVTTGTGELETDISETTELVGKELNYAWDDDGVISTSTNPILAKDTIHYSVATSSGTVTATYTVAAEDTMAEFLKHIEGKFKGAGTDEVVDAMIVEGRICVMNLETGDISNELTLLSSTTSDGTVAGRMASDIHTAFGTLLASNQYGQVGTKEKTNIVYDFSAVNKSWGDDGKITWNISSDDSPEVTSYAMDSRVQTMSNDGYPAGLLNSLDVGGDGIITGFFTNGQQQFLARIRTAAFSSNDGLSKVGSYFTETSDSGAPTLGNPGEGGLGKTQSHSLEISNTDVAKEFIKMIAAQRAYQSSSKIITATDQMLQELMQIKR